MSLDTNSNQQTQIGIKLYHEVDKRKQRDFLNSYSLLEKSKGFPAPFHKTLLNSF